jgi:hypothetical protein
MKPLENEFNYYLENQEKLVDQYEGKYIVIRGNEVVGSYDSEIEAIERSSEKYELGTFLVQLCAPGEDNYTQVYHSRVAFA